jgi:hypothetical protein
MPTRFEDILPLLSQVHNYGKYVSAICPFHDDTKPSLMVYKDGMFHCLGCGKTGNLKALERALRGWNPTTVRERMAWNPSSLPDDLYDLEDIANQAHDMLCRYDDTLGWYLKERKVFSRIYPQHLGYWNGWYTIPIFGWENEFLGMVTRANRYIQKVTGRRFNMPRGQGSLLYIPDYSLVRDSDYLVCVYGMFDALALTELRVPVCTGTAGKGSLSPTMLDWCRKRIIIVPDKGEDDTARKLAGGLSWRSRVLSLEYPEGTKDPADCLQKGYGDWMVSQIWRIK